MDIQKEFIWVGTGCIILSGITAWFSSLVTNIGLWFGFMSFVLLVAGIVFMVASFHEYFE